MKNPYHYITLKSQTIDLFTSKIDKLFQKKYQECNAEFLKVASKLNSLSPTNVLLRGYSVVYKDDKIIASEKHLKKGDIVKLQFADGIKNAEIK